MVWVLEPETSNIGYLDPLGFESITLGRLMGKWLSPRVLKRRVREVSGA